MPEAADEPGWVQSKGFPPAILVGIYGFPNVLVFVHLLTWIVLPPGSVFGLQTEVAFSGLYLAAAVAMVFVVLRNSHRPRAVKPGQDGIAVRPIFGAPFLITWKSVNPRLTPEVAGFQKVDFADPKPRTAQNFVVLSKAQADAVLTQAAAPRWTKPD